MQRYNKAVAALLTPLLTWLVLQVGLEVDKDTVAAIVVALTPIIVGLIPNKP
jgi:predicted Na+-dependent transporter